MAIRKNILLEELYNLRDNLRLELQKNNETKTICNDEALYEMSKKKPSRLSDILAISGLDKDFLDRFAHLFLEVILKHSISEIKTVKVSKEASIVLDRYKDRLTDISKTNPNLYMGKIEKITSFDLYDLNRLDEIEQFVSLKKTKYLFDGFNENIFEHLTTLYRQLNKDFKDFGYYHLYVGYPYIEGIFKKEEFPVKAPLAYLPVILERNKKTYTLIIDQNKDIVFNRDLLLTLAKIEKLNVNQDLPELKDLSAKTVNEMIIPAYLKHGLVLSKEQKPGFLPFKNELKHDFLKTHKSAFVLKNFITFGRYELYSSMIQKDMAEIIESNTYNELLEGLIDETNLYDDEKSLDVNVSNIDIDESNLIYINDINFSQEKVIEMIDQEKKIVIWGPPGTGKSQTITSLIAHQVLRGENVLVVSEKKVALDVIYSRLGAASSYAMMIDDAAAKQKFFDQISSLIDQKTPSRKHNNDVYRLEESIKELDTTFNQAIRLLYQTKRQGKPIAYFYERYIKDKEIIEELTPKHIYHLMNQHIKDMSFDDIAALEMTFDTDKKLREFLDYHKYKIKYPWFSKIETQVTRSSLIEFKGFIDELIIYQDKIKKAWIFKKRKLTKQFIESHDMKLKDISIKKSIDKQLVKALISDHDFSEYLSLTLKNLNKIKTNYNKLTETDLSFLSLLTEESVFQSNPTIEKQRTYLFNAYITGFLEEFKARHQKYLFIFDNYEKKMNELKTLIDEKQTVTRESFEMKLFQNAFELSNTKRIMDIKRILESDRLPSIKAFIDLFKVELFSHIKIWLLTPEALSSVIPLQFNLFDLVIFDEASQMYVEKGIPAIYRAKKVVIAGDPKQLRPSSLGFGRLDENDPFEEDELLRNVTFDAKSLLDLARYKYKEALLNYHYRSHYQELIEFSNHAFYEGKLIISPNQVIPKEPPISYIYVKEGSFVHKSNLEEGKAVIELLKRILKDKEPSDSIGIITFNSVQRDLILNLIDEELFKTSVHQKRLETELFRQDKNEDQSLFVKNIENVQGDERDIIIFSMGYAKDETGVVKRRFGWLNHEGGQNRLNVAITRAKKKIYFVSSLYPESFKVDDLSGKGPKLLKDFMRYCFYISANNPDAAKSILESLYHKESETKKKSLSILASDLKQRLIKLGYLVDESIGIGQFKIDLAIFNDETRKFDLGIICDLTDDYDPIARKELFHQEKFLNSRGWKIYRVFHMNFYENPNKVIKDIKDYLKMN